MKNVKAPRPVIIASLTLVTVVFWIIFGILRIIVRPEDVNVPDEILSPLTPELDTNILSDLGRRVFLLDSDIGQITIGPSPTPLPTPETTPESSPSPSPESSESPTGSPTPTPIESPSPSP